MNIRIRAMELCIEKTIQPRIFWCEEILEKVESDPTISYNLKKELISFIKEMRQRCMDDRDGEVMAMQKYINDTMAIQNAFDAIQKEGK